MPARLVVVLSFVAVVAWFTACSKGIGNNLPRPSQPVSNGSDNLPVGFDPGFVPTAPIGETAVAGAVIPAFGANPARELVLLAFTTAARADDADGNGAPLSRDVVTDGNGASDVFVAAVSARDIDTSAFSQSLAGKFRHPRCTTCHSMAAPTTLAFASSALPHAGPPPGIGFPTNDPATCVPCHVTSTADPVETWQAPAASFDLRDDTVAELAARAERIPAGELEHFTTDRRVLWALDSGILPTVGGRNGVADDDHDGVAEPEDDDGVARPVPGGSAAFLQEIDDWIAGGRVVDSRAAVRDVTLVSRAAGTTNAANGASTAPRLVFVANPGFNPATAVTAANTNPVGTVHVVFTSAATDAAAGDGNAVSDVYRASIEVRVEEDTTGAASPGGINLVWLDATVLVSARNGVVAAGNGASTAPAIGGATGDVVVFQSAATDLVAGFTDGNGTAADVYVRRITTQATLLVSHTVGNAATGGDGASEAPAIDASGAAVAFESTASDLIAADLNGRRDVFHARIDSGSPFTKQRSSVTAAGAEATGGDSSAASVHADGARILVVFQSDATDIAPALVAPTNVLLFDSDTGTTTLLNQRVSAGGDAVGDGSARAPQLGADGATVVFESDAANIDVLRADGNRASDVFVVDVAQLTAGNVLPFRISTTVADGADGDGASTRPRLASFGGSADFAVGFVAYTTAARNLGAADGSDVIVSFLNETSGVFADFDLTPARGAVPLVVQFTDRSSGTPTSWQWDFDGDGTVDSTVQNPTFTYTTPGSFAVRLVVRDANAENTKTTAGAVLAVGPITPDFTASVTTGTTPLTVTFTDTSTQSPTSWQWDFDDDGTIDSTVQNPTHVYSAAGTYTVRLVATNEAGAATETKTDLITAFVPVVASFTRTPVNGVAPLQVTFTNASTGATSFAWDFDEDGVVDSTAADPTFVYASSGTFDVTLTATGPGGTDVFTFADCVTVFGAVNASFTMTVGGNPITSAYEATSITFTSTSTGTISTVAWDFDFIANPGTSTSSNATVTRNFANTTTSTRAFVVRLAVSGPGGSSTTQQTLTIVSDTESATFNPNIDTTIYENLTGNSNGAGTQFVVGRPAGTISAPSAGFSRRALLRFDIGAIPTGSTINSATMQITSDTPVATTGTQTIGLHRVTEGWTEGTANGTAGIGAVTAGNGATWLNRTGSTAWASAGGDFVAAATATFTGVATPATHTSGSLATDVQAWLDLTEANFGWLLKNADESVASTAKRFWTRTGTTPPVLSVNYTRPLP